MNTKIDMSVYNGENDPDNLSIDHSVDMSRWFADEIIQGRSPLHFRFGNTVEIFGPVCYLLNDEGRVRSVCASVACDEREMIYTFADLSRYEQNCVLLWIDRNIVRSDDDNFDHHDDSRSLKGKCERFVKKVWGVPYLSEQAFKAAMMLVGIEGIRDPENPRSYRYKAHIRKDYWHIDQMVSK